VIVFWAALAGLEAGSLALFAFCCARAANAEELWPPAPGQHPSPLIAGAPHLPAGHAPAPGPDFTQWEQELAR